MASANSSQNDVDSGSSSDINPWESGANSSKLLDPSDPTSQAALKGFHIGVATGKIDPVDGVNRLKKIGVVHPSTKPEDLLPPGAASGAAAGAPQMGPPAPGAASGAAAGANPWQSNPQSKLVDPTDLNAQAALHGFHVGVQTGKIDPVDGLNRLKKMGAIHPDTQLPEVLPPSMTSSGPRPPGNAPSNQSNVTPPQANPWAQNAFNAGKTGDMSQLGLMASAPMEKTSTGSQTKDETKQTMSTSAKKFDPEDFNLRMAVAQGHQVTPKLGPNGEPQVDPNTGRNLYQIGDVDPNAPYQKQSAGLDRIQNLLNMEAGMKAKASPFSQLDLTPAMRLGEIMTGSKGDVESYQKSNNMPENPAAFRARLIASEQGIQGDRAKLQQSLYDNLKATQPTLTYNDLLAASTGNTQTAGKSEQSGMPPALAIQIAKMGQGQERIDQRGALGAQQVVNKDQILNTYQQRIDGANKIMNLMNAADDGKVASTQAMLGQLNAEIARLETGSQSPGLGAAEKTEMSNFSAQLSAVRDAFSGAQTPVDLKNAFKQARGMVSDLRSSYVDAQKSRMAFLGTGALPNQQATFGAKQAGLGTQNGKAPRSTPKAQPPGGSPNPDLPGAMIPVIDPNGRRGKIPAEDWPEAQKSGYKKAGG